MTILKPTPTLLDVAKTAGVSTATVSRCLNFPTQVKPKTREKVQAAIDLLGYSPNFGAKVMAAKRTNTIGAIIPTMDNAIFARGLQAFQEELRLHGYTMLIASSTYEPEIEADQIRSLIARGADALLLIGHARLPEINTFIAAQNVPALVAWAFDPEAIHPSVGFDNKQAMFEMTQAVLDRGHSNLALITANTTLNDRAAGRLRGIKDAMTQRGIDPSTLTTIETNYTIECGAQAFAKLMQTNPRPTAVLCGNDVLAVGALRQARALGLSVPGDVSITGFDDIELAQIADPALTTVHVPHREMGQQAAQTLVAMLNGAVPASGTPLQTKVVKRASLGPAPKA